MLLKTFDCNMSSFICFFNYLNASKIKNISNNFIKIPN